MLILSTSGEFFYPTTTSKIMTFGTHTLDGSLYLPVILECCDGKNIDNNLLSNSSVPAAIEYE
jgi:hypothetical protein